MLRSGDYRYRSLSVICRSTGNWEIAEPLVVGGYVAQACGVANIHWVEELLHWQQGSSRRVREHLASYLHIHQPSIIGSLRRSGHPLSSWYQISSVASVRIHPIHPLDWFCFRPIQKKPYKNIRVSKFCHSLDCIGVFVFSCCSLCSTRKFLRGATYCGLKRSQSYCSDLEKLCKESKKKEKR